MSDEIKNNEIKDLEPTVQVTEETIVEEQEYEPLVMRFTNNAYHDIVNTIGNKTAESGGLLFGKLDDYVVRKFVYDKDARVTGGSYTFNTKFLNPEIKRLWDDEKLACIGFIHSHPWGMKTPSYMDMRYFHNMFPKMPRIMYLVPIVSTIPDGGFNLNPCILFEGDKDIVVADKIELEIEPHESQYYDMLRPRWGWGYHKETKEESKEEETINNTMEVEEVTDAEPVVDIVVEKPSPKEEPKGITVICFEKLNKIIDELRSYFGCGRP